MDNSFKDYRLPDKRGHFKQFGGKYVPETLIPALEELEHHYDKSKEDSVFQTELYNLLKHYAGRETALYHAARISEELGFDVWLGNWFLDCDCDCDCDCGSRKLV